MAVAETGHATSTCSRCNTTIEASLQLLSPPLLSGGGPALARIERGTGKSGQLAIEALAPLGGSQQLLRGVSLDPSDLYSPPIPRRESSWSSRPNEDDISRHSDTDSLQSESGPFDIGRSNMPLFKS